MQSQRLQSEDERYYQPQNVNKEGKEDPFGTLKGSIAARSRNGNSRIKKTGSDSQSTTLAINNNISRLTALVSEDEITSKLFGSRLSEKGKDFNKEEHQKKIEEVQFDGERSTGKERERYMILESQKNSRKKNQKYRIDSFVRSIENDDDDDKEVEFSFRDGELLNEDQNQQNINPPKNEDRIKSVVINDPFEDRSQ